MPDNTDIVLFERRGNIALLTLNRPNARNAISPEVSQAMAGFLDEIEADDELRAVVLTGAGDVFSRRRRPQGRRPGPRAGDRTGQGRVRRAS